jgi:hypothetical protein
MGFRKWRQRIRAFGRRMAAGAVVIRSAARSVSVLWGANVETGRRRQNLLRQRDRSVVSGDSLTGEAAPGVLVTQVRFEMDGRY